MWLFSSGFSSPVFTPDIQRQTSGGEVKVRQALFRNSDRAAQISAAELGDEKAKGRWEGGEICLGWTRMPSLSLNKLGIFYMSANHHRVS